MIGWKSSSDVYIFHSQVLKQFNYFGEYSPSLIFSLDLKWYISDIIDEIANEFNEKKVVTIGYAAAFMKSGNCYLGYTLFFAFFG